ncbi:MAG: hypothetical protein Q9179_003186 [Wetmoreana sp. 5 TL-2023]
MDHISIWENSADQSIARQSWNTVPLLYVTSLESPFGIVALCGPPINQFFRRAHSFGWRSLLTTKKYASTSDPAANFEKLRPFDRSREKKSQSLGQRERLGLRGSDNDKTYNADTKERYHGCGVTVI